MEPKSQNEKIRSFRISFCFKATVFKSSGGLNDDYGEVERIQTVLLIYIYLHMTKMFTFFFKNNKVKGKEGERACPQSSVVQQNARLAEERSFTTPRKGRNSPIER